MKLYKLSFLNLCLWLAVISCACYADPVTLKDTFAGKFLIGAAVNDDQMLDKNPQETEIIIRQFNSITPENILKWEKVHPKSEQYDFAPADRLVAFAQEHKMFVVGHTLVWHNQTPRWVFQDPDGKPASKEMLLERMKDHISTVVGRYKGKIQSWDVINEAVDEDGTLRKSKWLEIAGEDFIFKAFEYAHQADLDAELYYNDYNMWKKEHRDGVIRLVKELQSKGLRIDGIGMQGHWGMDYPPMDELEDSMVAYASLGVKVMFTEMDITILPSASSRRGADITQNYELRKELNPYPDGLPDQKQEELAKRYGDIFALFVKHADKIGRVTFWGVQDGNSWRNYWPVRGRTDYPLLFDRDCKPKPAFYAVIKTAGSETK